MPLPEDDAKDHDSGKKLYIHHDGNIFDVFADSPVVLPVGHLVLVEILFIRIEPEHSSRPMLKLIQQSHCLDLPQLFGDIHDEHVTLH